MQNVLLVWALCGLCVPLTLALQSVLDPTFQLDRFPTAPLHIYWLRCLRVVWIWAQGPVFLLIEFIFETLVTVKLRTTRYYISQLVHAKPANQTFIMNIAQ